MILQLCNWLNIDSVAMYSIRYRLNTYHVSTRPITLLKNG